MKNSLTAEDFQHFATVADLQVADVQTVCKIESNGHGFDDNDLPIILFEGHVFSRLTNHRFDNDHPTISYPEWTNQFYPKGPTTTVRNTKNHARLAEAADLDRDAALQSASWGLFQLMGFNFKDLGFADAQDFVNAMYESEMTQLAAFISWIMVTRKKTLSGDHVLLVDSLRQHRWADFAYGYNGSGYAANQYDVKLAMAYASLS